MELDKQHSPKISVVIPMYNCEQFVHGVLSMFSEQSFKDFELICVIDGATDGTEAEVKKYCETDDRFRYVVRENGGAGAARNTGMDMAQGKYIVFPDADDIFEKDFLLKLYEAAEEHDAQMVLCGAVTYDYLAEEQRKTSGFNKSVLTQGKLYSANYTKHILGLVDVSNQNKMFLLDFIKASGIRYSETPASNDLFFSKAILASAERIAVIHDDLVTIRRCINPQSVSSNRGVHSHIAITELNKLYNWLNERGILGIHISEYLRMFDNTLNYEMKNGVNTLLAEEAARTLNCEKPWVYMNSEQIMQVLKNSFGEKSGESIKPFPKDVTYDEKEKIKAHNDIINNRNKSRVSMQKLIKKASVDLYKRDFDDLNSVSPFRDTDCDYLQSHNEPEKSESPQITVVIPMYNCAEYVSGVLSMFTAQSFTDFEVICVIDGATDNTEDLVKEFCDKDTRFCYIVRENGGPGAARNTGLYMARGKYIVFSDADDEYSPEYLKKMYETAVRHDAQIVVSRFIKKNILTNVDIVSGFDKGKIYENVIYSHKGIGNLFVLFSPNVNNKLFNLNFIRNGGLYFPDIRVSEDAFFSYAALSIAERIVVIYDTLHTYRRHINQNSLSTHRLRFQHDSVESLRRLYKWLKNNSLLDSHKEDFINRVDSLLIYEGENGTTPRFISEFAHFINAEGPFDKMTSDEILNCLGKGLLAKDAVSKEKELSSRCSLEFVESDKELSYLVKSFRNRIHTGELLLRVSNERYNRGFLKSETFPFTTADNNKNEENNNNADKKKIVLQGTQECFEQTPLKVHWMLTEACNYRCSYCFNKKSGYRNNSCTLEEAETAVKHLAMANRSSYEVSLLGGEPTLYPYLAEVISIISKYLGKRLRKISMITNGSFNDKTIQTLLDLSSDTGIEVKISLHFEYVEMEKMISLIEKMSNRVSMVFLVMFQPDLFDRVAAAVDKLCEMRKVYPFGVSIELIRQPGNTSQYHENYTEEHFAWAEAAQKRFNEADEASTTQKPFLPDEEGWAFILERIENGELLRNEKVSVAELEKLTSYNFKGMMCCVGTNIIDIVPDGTARGLVCNLASDKFNIFKENPFRPGGIIKTVECTKKRCNCNIDYRTPKFLNKKDAQIFIRYCQSRQEELTESYMSKKDF